MAVAPLFAQDDGKGERGKKTSESAGGFGRELLCEARVVLAYSPEEAYEAYKVHEGQT